jgi:hypothetical protein
MLGIVVICKSLTSARLQIGDFQVAIRAKQTSRCINTIPYKKTIIFLTYLLHLTYSLFVSVGKLFLLYTLQYQRGVLVYAEKILFPQDMEYLPRGNHSPTSSCQTEPLYIYSASVCHLFRKSAAPSADVLYQKPYVRRR